MARYQLKRPLPVVVVPRRVRRQATGATSVPAPAASEQPEAEEPEEEEPEGGEEEEGPESPDSPLSSASSAGASSESDDSDSDDDEPPSPAKNSVPPSSEQAPSAAPSSLPAAPSGNSYAAISQGSPSSAILTLTSAASGVASQTRPLQPAFTVSFSSQGNLAAGPQIPGSTFSTTTTQPASTLLSSIATRPTSTTSPITTTTQPSDASSVTQVPSSDIPSVQVPSSAASPPSSAQSETAGQNLAPQRSSPQEEKTMITKGGAAAAITLSIIGALAIVLAAFICLKRRKRRQNQYNQRLADDAFNPSNSGSLHAPETAHVADDTPMFLNGAGSHLTRSTERSNTLFGAGPYTRPETVSTDRSRSRFPIAPPQPTPNPFADPPLNKAYDVLAGRPRSTTLTDRGSWVKNPFRNPESERFDPFGELQEKARAERRKYLETARLEAEAERQRQFGEKEKMGLGVPEEMKRKGSGVTIAGVGVLDRSGGPGGFRDV